MDDLTFNARRASAGAAAKTAEPADPETRFRTLVQSPLRAGLLRYLSARPDESFDVESLMQTFGRLRLDVENCVKELVDFGVAQAIPGNPPRYMAGRPASGALGDLLDLFLERRATVSTEDQSPSVQRFREMIGRDEKMLIVFEWIRTAAKSDISVLILGPTGSGKEVVARMIHELSRRTVAKFQAVNCAALPDTLFESEIFGYEKGAFTGAHDRKPGRLELANDGTLFLERFRHDPGEYPDSGATIEVYSNHEFLELEHLGPLTTIKPGEEIVLPEDWWLFIGVSVPTGGAEALTTLQSYVARASTP